MKLGKGLEIKLPIAFNHMNLGGPISEDQARDAIKAYAGKTVLLKNAPRSTEEGPYLLGIAKPLENDSECYEFERIGSNEIQRHHYHDLEGLMIPFGTPIDVKPLK